MAKLEDLSKGDRVAWETSQGRTTGTVDRIMTKPFSIKGTDLKASKEDPRVVVRSEKTGAEAGHKPSALRKLVKKKTSAKDRDAKSKDAKAKDTKTKAKDTKAKSNDSKAKSKDSKSSDTKSKDAKKSK